VSFSFSSRPLKNKKPQALVCPRLRIKLDDQSTHGQTPPVEIKKEVLPGLIDIIFGCFHYFASLLLLGF
jgi:hypothetical protein